MKMPFGGEEAMVYDESFMMKGFAYILIEVLMGRAAKTSEFKRRI